MSKTIDERDAFEDFAIRHRDEHNLPFFVLKDDNGDYIDGGTRFAWEGWKARSAINNPSGAKEPAMTPVGTVRIAVDVDEHEIGTYAKASWIGSPPPIGTTLYAAATANNQP